MQPPGPTGRAGRPTPAAPPADPAERAAPGRSHRRGVPGWALGAGLLAWAVTYLLAFVLRVVPLWPAVALLSAVSWWAAWRPDLPARLRPTPRLVAMGLATGLLLGAVFVAGGLFVRQTPLGPLVADAVGVAWGGAPWPLAVLVIVLGTSPAEEVLWRGGVYAAVAGWLGSGWRAVVVTTLLYACFVGLSGNSALALAALACGLVWARQRQVTGSLVPCVVGHATWTLLMFAVFGGVAGQG